MERKPEHGDSRRGSSTDRGGADVSPGIERQIDENLRLIYHQALEEGVPAPLQALADQLQELLSRDEPRNGGGSSPNTPGQPSAFDPPTA